MECLCVCLLPTGSAAESINGISHLFEHLFISKLRRSFRESTVTAYTTEDYVILFCDHLTPKNIIDSIRRINFEILELGKHKETLVYEITSERSTPKENFFRFVWKGTDYEKSPLGTIDMVNSITGRNLEDLKYQIIKQNIFFYTREKGVKIINETSSDVTLTESLHLPTPMTWEKNRRFQGKNYDIYYFNRDIEIFYLLERILKQLNTQTHIQLSEKKHMSALILEKGMDFPSKDNIDLLKEKAVEEIKKELSGIKSNFNETALNELESTFFYGKNWAQRISRLFQTTNQQLLDLLKNYP